MSHLKTISTNQLLQHRTAECEGSQNISTSPFQFPAGRKCSVNQSPSLYLFAQFVLKSESFDFASAAVINDHGQGIETDGKIKVEDSQNLSHK